jgi:hypothetical protein
MSLAIRTKATLAAALAVAALAAASLVVVQILARSTSPPGPPSRIEVRHLTSGAILTTGETSVTTAPITPTLERVFVSVMGLTHSTTPVPTVAGGGVSWQEVSTAQKKPGAPRRLTLFSARGLTAGPLTIGFPSEQKSRWMWAIAETDATNLVEVVPQVRGSLETSHCAGVPDLDPGHSLLGVFGIGQPFHDVEADSGFTVLGQFRTDLATIAQGYGSSSEGCVFWQRPAHALGIAVEIAL